MADNLIHEGTEDTPKVEFDRTSNVFRISGRSYPENPRDFYQPIYAWLADYGTNPNPSTHFEVELDYFNSGSVKEVFKLLYLVEDILESGKEAKVIWCYKKGDELMLQKGQEFQNLLEVPIELKEC